MWRRFFALMALTFVAVLAPLPVFAAAALLYALFYFAPELLLLSLIIDSVFGIEQWPHYTIAVVLILIVVEAVRPRFSFYT